MNTKISEIQKKCVNEIVQCFKTNKFKVVLAACGGAGKTFMAFDVINEHYQINSKIRVLFITHATTILKKNCTAQFKEYSKLKQPKFTLCEGINKNFNVNVCLPQDYRKIKEHYDLVIVDEANDYYFAESDDKHMSMHKRINEIVKPKFELLLTATPSRFVLKNDIAKNKKQKLPYKIIPIPMIDLLEIHVSDVLIDLASSSLKVGEYGYNRSSNDLKDEKILDFNNLFESKIAEELLQCILRKLKSAFRTNPVVYRLAHTTNVSDLWKKSFRFLKKTMIIAPNQFSSEIIKQYFEKQIGAEYVSLSNSDCDKPSIVIQEFKTNKKLILIVVDRANLGFNYPDLINLVDLTFSRNINRIYQMLCRVNRISRHKDKKLFFKVVPNVEATYFEHIMTCVLCLMHEYWLLRYNGKNFLGTACLKIPIKKQWKKGSIKKTKSTLKQLNLYEGIPSLQSFKDIVHKDRSLLNTYKYATLVEVKRELLEIRTVIPSCNYALEKYIEFNGKNLKNVELLLEKKELNSETDLEFANVLRKDLKNE